MKQISILLFSLMLLMSFTACGNQAVPVLTAQPEEAFGESAPASSTSEPAAVTTGTPSENIGETTESFSPATEDSAEPAPETEVPASNILIAYFTMPEDVDTTGVDAVASASIVVQDGEALGSNQFVAELIQSVIGGDLFEIRTEQQYPLDHEPLVDQASEEQDENARPALSVQLEHPEQYDTILLGYPNWWGDMPMPLYTFLESYDFSGKTIIPFCTHGGSGFSRTIQTIAELQPNATVSEDGLLISRNDVADAEEDILRWAEGLNS